MAQDRTALYKQLRTLCLSYWISNRGATCVVCNDALGDDLDKLAFDFAVHPNNGGGIAPENLDWLHARCSTSYKRNIQR